MSNKLEFYSNFKSRFEPDPYITYFMPEEFNVSRIPMEVECDGNILRGFDYNPNAKKTDAIVIFAHGMWTTVDAYNQDICYLCNHGYEVIAINNIGVGPSEGKTILGLGGCLKALDAVVAHVKTLDKYKDRKIYLMGHSWGGHAVCNIVKFHPDIAKVVSLAPYVSELRLFWSMTNGFYKLLAPFIVLDDARKLGKYSLQNSIHNLKRFKGETLILHSTNDPLVNYDLHTKVLRKRVPNLHYMINFDRCHNPNYTENAIKETKEYLNKLKACKTEKEQIEVKKNTNFHSLGELDNDVMEAVIEFLDK